MSLTYYLLIFAAVIVVSPLCHASNANVLRPFLGKPYRLVSSDENFDKVLKKLGIGWLRRKSFELARPWLALSFNPFTKIYTLTETSILDKIEVSFQFGKEFSENTVDGRRVHEVFRLHGTTVVETQKQPGKHNLVIEREFSDEHVVVKVHMQDITSFRVYDAL